jgi:hypothetical protein
MNADFFEISNIFLSDPDVTTYSSRTAENYHIISDTVEDSDLCVGGPSTQDA